MNLTLFGQEPEKPSVQRTLAERDAERRNRAGARKAACPVDAHKAIGRSKKKKPAADIRQRACHFSPARMLLQDRSCVRAVNYFTASLNSRPGRNFGTVIAGIL